MGHGLANVMNMLGPQMIILGGGVMKGWPLFAPVALEIIRRRDTVAPIHAVKIAAAAWAVLHHRRDAR